MKRIFISLLAAGSLGACGQRHPVSVGNRATADIVHGTSVRKSGDDGLAKSVVALVLNGDEGEGLCTGSILDDETILTAAHCVDRGEEVAVIFGPSVKSARQTRAADAAVTNPGWQRTEEGGDLALIHFTGGLPDGYEPVKLASANVDLQAGTHVEMLGYGISNADRRSGAGILRQTGMAVMQTLGKDQYLTDGSQSSVCFGDSGGPAFVVEGGSYVQWGVAHAVTSASCNQSAIHTSVGPYLRWIESTRLKLAGRKAAHG